MDLHELWRKIIRYDGSRDRTLGGDTMTNRFTLTRALSCATAAMCFMITGALPAMAQDYNEAPGLKDLVTAGDLPELSDRLPANPMVLDPLDSVGEYG